MQVGRDILSKTLSKIDEKIRKEVDTNIIENWRKKQIEKLDNKKWSAKKSEKKDEKMVRQ